MSDPVTVAPIAAVAPRPVDRTLVLADPLASLQTLEALLAAREAKIARVVQEERALLARMLGAAPDGSPRHARPDDEPHFQKLVKAAGEIRKARGLMGALVSAVGASGSLLADATKAREGFLAAHEAQALKAAEFLGQRKENVT